jgi:prepilin-type N-terminal cleavage/methylation domain-containing protein
MMARDPQHGFTLLELMISLAVMSMIALMIGTSLSSSARVLTQSTAYAVAVEHALARRDLRRVVEASLSLPFPENEQPLFDGASASFRFQAIVDDGVFWPGAPVVGEVARDDQGQVVLTLAGLSDASQADFRSVTILTGPDGDLEISYFGRKSVNTAPGWSQIWPADQGVPMAVKIVMTDGEDILPPLVIQPSKRYRQSEMSLSSLVPPATPSRP